MATELGVSEHHQTQVINYMRFARYQRAQRLRAVDMCFDNVKDSRLTDETFTVDEVIDILDGLLAVVRGEVETELINTAHTNILMMRQMFIQAEKWHLKLQADISELENRDLLEQIKDFEEREFSGAKRETEFTPSKLAPLNETGGTALLHMKIEELQDEAARLQERIKLCETQMTDEQKRKVSLAADLAKSQAELRGRKNVGSNEEADDLRHKMAELETDLKNSHLKNKNTAEGMETDLAGAKHELLRIREMLEMAEKELEKKVSQTAPFKNLKQMLMKKNDQIKDLRKRLSKYETLDD
ncbi:leucine zipper transcription factor-like protein 1 isoform X2 [Gigantopelta aegis]|uniref:leucine zipper transcription factor-like protein 1 isoform X2 n=1 Tax=Gigantopelta aegis TaxID=1735272 RepID=UPI001B88A9A9|nr:leucine zipper transcription factor-like protein 1 isoform X2 [Gigantopelta aegis]